MIDEREMLALIEWVLEVVDVTHTEMIGDAVIDAVGKVVDEWVLVIVGDTLDNTENVTADDEDGTLVSVDVTDASIETVVV